MSVAFGLSLDAAIDYRRLCDNPSDEALDRVNATTDVIELEGVVAGEQGEVVDDLFDSALVEVDEGMPRCDLALALVGLDCLLYRQIDDEITRDVVVEVAAEPAAIELGMADAPLLAMLG